ncbi:MAG: hypothetical protein A2X59_10270 [Nitrospirae bacterium GWC2_42_7]|nr:MAG: hypothetical protein A2X59_10270 [Nitrospirae bacterium GWC2_42_7]
MKRIFLLFSLVFLIFQTGCAKSLRYSPEEIKDFPVGVQERIKNSEIDIGMSKLHVRYSWGGPEIVNVLPPDTEGNERVEWTYKKLHLFKTRLIFTDDKLSQIISTEPGIMK